MRGCAGYDNIRVGEDVAMSSKCAAAIDACDERLRQHAEKEAAKD